MRNPPLRNYLEKEIKKISRFAGEFFDENAQCELVFGKVRNIQNGKKENAVKCELVGIWNPNKKGSRIKNGWWKLSDE